MKYNKEETKFFERIGESGLDSYEKFFKQFYRPMLSYTISFLHNEQDAEDVIQEVFYKFWKNKSYKKIMDFPSLKSYLFRSVHNACMNRFRKKHLPSYSINEIKAELTTTDQLYFSDELIESVKVKLNKLPSRTREVIIAVYFHKLKYKEAADNLEVSVNTIKTLLRHGINKLRNEYKDF